MGLLAAMMQMQLGSMGKIWGSLAGESFESRKRLELSVLLKNV
jgi:hypothetical protein